MDIYDIQETRIWQLFEKGRNYHRLVGIPTDTDRNYRFYNGNQWEGLKLEGVEPVQKNFIKPIVKYKCAVIHDNLYAINISSLNFENMEFQKEAKRYCEMLNRYFMRVWEKEKMDFKGREITKDSAINDEGIIYVDFDEDTMMPAVEIIKKNDIFYGNENNADIQKQPYILIRKRMPVSNAIEYALAQGMSEDKVQFIVGDTDNHEQSGDASKQEVDNMVTIVYKLYKKNGTVHFAVATRFADIVEDVDTGLTLYPVAHFNWEAKEGSARGEGEVRYLIPNQIEVNKTEMRRVLTVKTQAYPQKVANISKITNPQAVNTVGGIIKTSDQTVDDVRKIVGIIPPAQMSPDVVKLQEDLINVSRELAGAGDTATGQVNPEDASGRAILAVQQASQSPITEQKENFKNLIEDFALITIDYLTVYSVDGVKLEDKVTDENGEETIQIYNMPQSVLQELKPFVKVDVTPKSVYDKFAQEQTIENLLIQGYFTAERVGELETYVSILDDDSVAPKVKILEAIEHIKDEQKKIAMIQAEAQMMQQRANQFLMEDPDMQADQVADAMEVPMEEEMAEETEIDESNPDDN